MHAPTTLKQVCAFLGLVGCYKKFIKDFVKIAKLLTLLTRQQVKFEWTPAHQETFMKLKDSIIQTPILWYPNPSKRYIVYTDTSDNACRAQLTQEHNDTEFPIAFLSHSFLETPQKWSTTEQEAYGVYMLSPNGITISKLQISESGMITSHSLNFEWKECK